MRADFACRRLRGRHVLDEEGAVDELYRRMAGSLRGSEWEAIFVDDGSTDGTYARLRALHESDPRVRVVRFKRNFGQHPAMHAGLSRARGARIVTMDGDLQNEPEDIPKLLEALDRADVASGRRVARRDSPGRTLPSRVINGLLRRFTGVSISDFGCAFNGYRREAIEPMLGAIGRQKFTKALVLSSGVSVEEVDVSHAAAASGSRYSPLRLVRLALHVSPGSGLSRCSGSGSRSASSARSPLRRSGSTASSTGSCTATSPGRSSPEQALFSCSGSKASCWR